MREFEAVITLPISPRKLPFSTNSNRQGIGAAVEYENVPLRIGRDAQLIRRDGSFGKFGAEEYGISGPWPFVAPRRQRRTAPMPRHNRTRNGESSRKFLMNFTFLAVALGEIYANSPAASTETQPG
jgi:hypothetical protein